MKHKMVLFLILGVICAPLIFAGSTFHSQSKGHEMWHDHLKKVAADLKLTETQKDSIHDIFGDCHKKMEGDLKTLATGHKDMLDLIHVEQFDESAFRAAFKKNSSALEEVVVQGAKSLHKVRGVLTVVQRDKLKEMIKQIHPAHGTGGACHGDLLKNIIKHVHGH